MIIYESRPDVTIEAAVIAFKSNNRIILKGGKEAYHSNMELVKYWHEALIENHLSEDWIHMLELNRQETQEYLKSEADGIDLIVPRGGEQLIKFVKTHAKCPVLVSGRGNNFLYVAQTANWGKTLDVILNAKTDKISACNALDKVLLDQSVPNLEHKALDLLNLMKEHQVKVIGDEKIASQSSDIDQMESEAVWKEEFLSRIILIATVAHLDQAIEVINEHSGHHSSVIMTEKKVEAQQFMEQVDSAAVYHNASTRFTDGGAMGVGAELAISTDKLHHRGPLGLKQLVSNKYYVLGDGHVR
jgi:glutamate-5-semialdehyde dehydrogenase